MSKKQDEFYFQSFIECAEASCKAAKLLKDTLTNFSQETISERMEEMHKVEHAADEKKHAVIDKLSKAFIVPIEREDIVLLSDNIDEVTDRLEDVLIRLYMNYVVSIRQEAIPLMEVVIKCCEEMKELLKDFADFRHSKTLKKHIIQINEMEEEADRLFMSIMRELHEKEQNPLAIIAWREIYHYMEKCADACEHVADTVESVVMKNS